MKLNNNRVLREKESKRIKESTRRLSIEYNPLNQVRKDLGLVSNQQEYNNKLLGQFVEEDALVERYGTNDITTEGDLVNFVLSSNMVLREIGEYKLELKDDVIEAISDFCKNNNINVRDNCSNFYILAPLSCFSHSNYSNNNLKHNVYYLPSVGGGDRGKNYIEIYGTDFKYKWYSSIVKIMNTKSDSETNFIYPLLIIILLFNMLEILLLLSQVAVGTRESLGFFIIVNLLLILGINLNCNRISKAPLGYLKSIKDTLESGKTKVYL